VVVVCDKAGAVLRTEGGTDRSLPDPRTRRPRRGPRHGRSIIRRSPQPPRDPTPPAEQAAKLDRVSHLGEGRHAQRPRAQLLRSVLGELVEQGVEHDPGLGAEALQELFVLTLHA
jgi:hypothetical protein